MNAMHTMNLMNPIVTSLSLLLATSGVAMAAPSPVTRVVVYPDRAQVTRTATVNCAPHTAVAFESIPPSADPASLRAHAAAGGTSLPIQGLRYEERTRKEAFAAEVTEIEKQLRTLDAERTVHNDASSRTASSRALATRYTDAASTLIAREMIDGAANAKSWTAAFDLALATRLRASNEDVDRAAKLRELDRKRADLIQRQQRLNLSSARREFFAEVLVSCPAGVEGKARVEITYVVGGAWWSPAYEARAEEAKSEVELTTWATVSQASGEPWKDATIVLSTALPRDNATPPEIAPLKIWSEEQKDKKKVLVARQEETRHAEASGDLGGVAGGVVGVIGGGVVGGGQGLRAASQGLSVQLVVPDAADVPGDGSPARLLVGRTKMKAQFAYRTVPKLMPFAFRVADVVNAAPYPLLPGTIDAFRRGGLTGRYPQERVAEGGRFQLTFGVEESFKVKRDVMQEVVRDKGLLGTTRRFRYAYRFEVANYLGAGEQLEVAEHIPVSEMDDVKVVIDPKVTSGYELKSDDGIVTWKIRLGQGEKRQFDLVYTVDVPASYDSGSL